MNKELLLNKDSILFLEKYLNTPSPTGNEVQCQKVWIEYIKKYVDIIETDYYGNAYGVINPNKNFKVIIEAHVDEISWYVNYISEDGFIYVIRNGGSDHIIAPSKVVNIHTNKKIIKGVFGWPAIHTRRSTKEDTPKVENIFIDVGCQNKQEVLDLGIDVGCMITYDDNFFELNNKYFVCRALDNRIGGYMIAQVARLIKENKDNLDFSLYITNCVQEEIGLRGAEMITNVIKPDIAIVTDVTHDTCTPMINKKIEGNHKCGAGPVIAYAPSIHSKLRDIILKTAKENNINIQKIANSRYTGTDTDAIAYSNGGVPSALISLPLKYMHTTVEMVDKIDVSNLINLIYLTLKNIKAEKKYFKYH